MSKQIASDIPASKQAAPNQGGKQAVSKKKATSKKGQSTPKVEQESESYESAAKPLLIMTVVLVVLVLYGYYG